MIFLASEIDPESVKWTFELIAAVIAVVLFVATLFGGGYNIIKKIRNKVRKTDNATAFAPKSSAVKNNLPSLNSIGHLLGKGRKKTQRSIIKILHKRRIVILYANGGIGKSTLARSIAEKMLHKRGRKYHAVIWISAKNAVVDIESTLKIIAQVLEYSQNLSTFDSIEERESAILGILNNYRVFFVFDNFESVTDEKLLHFIKDIPDKSRILVTTRNGEVEISGDQTEREIPPLDHKDSLDVIKRELTDKRINNVNEKLIERIYEITGGIPQAIIWAVGQLSYFTIEDIALEVNSGSGTIFEKLFASSWNLLDTIHKDIVRGALFFVSPVAKNALRAASGLKDKEFSEALLKLVSLSIVDHSQNAQNGCNFFSMHSWTRYFSTNRLQYNQGGDTDFFIASRLGKYYVDFCEKRYGKKAGLQGYAELEYELPNIIKLINKLDSDIASEDQNLQIIELARQLNVFLWSRGFWEDRILICNAAVNAAKRVMARRADNSLCSEAGLFAYYIGIVSFWQGKFTEAKKWAEISKTYTDRSSKELDKQLTNRLFALISIRSNTKEAIARFNEVLEALQRHKDNDPKGVALFADWIVLNENGHLVGIVSILQEMGICYNRNNDFVQAEQSLAISKEYAEQISDAEGLSVSLSHLGHSYYGLKNYDKAKECYEKGLEISLSIRRKSTMARCYEGLAKVYLEKKKKRLCLKNAKMAIELFEQLNMNEEKNNLVSILKNRKIIH